MAETKNGIAGVFLNGIFNENPTFRLVLGTCPTLAITTTAINGLGMGAATTFVLLGSNLVISLLRKMIPDKVRIPAFIVVISTFVTIVHMLLRAYIPSLNASLGEFIPLIVVNCIILARAESFASKNGVLSSAVDGVGMGAGFTIAITFIGSIREIISSGSIFGVRIMNSGYEPMALIGLAAGGFLTFGLLLGLINLITGKLSKKKEAGK